MKIQYCSDLHLEFKANKNFLDEHKIPQTGDILLLAGDIVPFKIMKQYNYFFDFLSDNYTAVYWVPGNHEYYYSDVSEKKGVFLEKIRDNIFLVNNYSTQIAGINFLFTTLWSNISPQNQRYVQQRMSDFQVISYQSEQFTPHHFNMLHKESKQFILTALKNIDKEKIIVVTHHVPTFLHYPEKYAGDILNEAFAVELFDFIETSGIDFWIFGHHHQNTPEFKIGKTSMLTNQLGYVERNEHITFNKYAMVEI